MTTDIRMAMLEISGEVTLDSKLHFAAMPEKWDDLFLGIWPSRKSWDRAIPYSSLGDALRLLFPDIAYIKPMYSRGITEGWLAAWSIPPSEPFIEVIKAWMRSEGTGRVSNELIEQIRWDDMKWSEQKLSFNYGLTENGTPNLDSELYNALPALICDELAGKSIEVAGRPLKFRRAFVQRESSLISWPPEDAGWSYLVHPAILTMPGCPDIFLSLRSSIRRWENTPLKEASEYNRLSAREDTLAYIELQDTWIAGARNRNEHSLIGVPMRLRPVQSNGEQKWMPTWSNNVGPILQSLWPDPFLPSSVELTNEPERYLNRKRGRIGITVPTSDRKHKVSTGVSLADRRDIFNGMAEHLQTWGFTAVESPSRVTLSARRKSPLRALKYSEIPGIDIIRSIQKSLRKDSLSFEIHFQTEATRSALRAEIWKRLLQGSDEPIPDTDKAAIADVDVEITRNRLGALGSALSGSDRRGTDKRIDEIAGELGHSEVPVACLVELQDADYFRGTQGADPKNAIRLGLAATGRISQFIVPPSEGDEVDENSVSSSVADLLRQLGNLPGAPFDEMPTTANLPADLQAVGVWVCKNNMPMLVHLASQGQITKGVRPLQVMLPTGVRGGEWYSYPEALLKVGGDEIKSIEKNQVRGVLKSMLRVFADDRNLRDVPLLMLCNDVNMRVGRKNVWGELNIDNLMFGKDEGMPWNTAGLKPRLARIRTDDRHLPQWFDDSLVWQSGLFDAPGRQNFLSLALKPPTLQFVDAKKSKRDAPFDRIALTDWNEITLAQLQDGDIPKSWAYVVHRLREMSAHYNDALSLPLPLHIAGLVEKDYILDTRKSRTRRRR